MRSTRRHKTTTNYYRQRVSKRRNKSRSTLPLECTHDVSILDLENLNNVLRVNKTQRAEGKGTWKVVPKDSCEVYKERRKRKAESNRQDDDSDVKSRRTDCEEHRDSGKRARKKHDRREKKEPGQKARKRRKPNKRRRSHVSTSSSMTTTTTINSSLDTSSEMDYE